MIHPLSPLTGAVAVGATLAGVGMGLTIGAGLVIAAHTAKSMGSGR